MSDENEPYVLIAGRVPPSGELMIADNLTGVCDTCGCKLQYRPHAPKPFILRCLICTVDQMEPGATAEIAPQMLADFREWQAKQRH